MKEKSVNLLLGIGIVVILMVVFFTSSRLSGGFLSPAPQPTEVWQKEYRAEAIEDGIDLDYTRPQDTIDYTDEDIQKIINDMEATSSQDALKKTTQYILDNIQYSSAGITLQYCYNEAASDVLALGKGDCVSMTKLGAALLRGQGVAVRTGGGCFTVTGRCLTLMGTTALPVEKADIWDGKKRGWLHEWAEVWIPGTGWVLVDFTNGAIYKNDCADYILYSYDQGDPNHICEITDTNFVDFCREV